MTVNANPRRAGPYVGTGLIVAYPWDFKIFEDTDLLIVRADLTTGVTTDLVIDSDYSVFMNPDQENNPGGTVSYLVGGVPTALPVTQSLTIVGNLPFTQPTDITNQGGFYPQVIEDSLDRVTMLVQQNNDAVERSLQLNVATDQDFDVQMPAPVAGNLLGWGLDGLSLANYDGAQSAPVVAAALAQYIADVADTATPAKGDALVGVKVSSTGSLARTQHERNEDRRSLLDFCDKLKAGGTSDASAAIALAITAARENGTGVLAGSGYMDIVVPVRTEGGLFRLDSQVVIPGEALIRFVGEGGPYFQSGFLQGFAGDMFTCTSGNFNAQFHNIRFQGQSGTYVGDYSAVRTAQDSVHAAFTSCMFREWGGISLRLANVFSCDFDNLIFYGNKGGGMRTTGGAGNHYGNLCTQVNFGFGLELGGVGNTGGPFFLEGDLIDNNPAGLNLSNRSLKISGSDNHYFGGTVVTNPLNDKTPVELAASAERNRWLAVSASSKGTATSWVTFGAGANNCQLGGGLQTALTGNAGAIATCLGELVGGYRVLSNGEVFFGLGSAASPAGFNGPRIGWDSVNARGYLRSTDPGVANRPLDLMCSELKLSHSSLGFYGGTAVAKPTITGAKAGNAALASLLVQLAGLGLITDSTT